MILKVTKNQGFALSIENTVLEKPHRGGQIGPPSLFQVKKVLLEQK